ncbi:bifunctional glutamate N-acetyltransferase/amino-acid acetyltransferase ArgJ [Clostridium sp. BJN0001]|uniref:bifunctional glutamate N-acetyltransferase/amino-acid acetyltransferase ArgJ n=1 Tax=Clostridium sp. BJN0001 TaxID=2930219 RepID=UPI001FD12830|nr:bifunctional glutamate N-acetyltransferase/amino-acid acetyltransferase ArgJ [Clostridium sp. BJN0001]
MKFKFIENGVTAPNGFKASGTNCGFKSDSSKNDLALIYSEVKANCAGMFTKNSIKGAHIYVSKKHLKDDKAQAVIINSGNANTCNNIDGINKAEEMTKLVAENLNLNQNDVLVASTGVIGVPLNIQNVRNGVPSLIKNLSYDGSDAAARGIMTTDTYKKEFAVSFTLKDGTPVKIGSITKGSGMIEPNMGTMLSFITTDLKISKNLLKDALKKVVKYTYNRVSVDGDTSTNDTVFIFANGMANNTEISEMNDDFNLFVDVLKSLCTKIAKNIAKDGEGATKLIECQILNAPSDDDALILAKSVINSSLVKTAIFGADANWGRVLCALGYTDISFDPEKVDVFFESKKGSIQLCKNGGSIPFSEEKAKEILLEDEIVIKVDLKCKNGNAISWGCDLSYEYVKINGDYRS